jgi:hypothetical protein
MQQTPQSILRRSQASNHNAVLAYAVKTIAVSVEPTDQAQGMSDVGNMNFIRLRIERIEKTTAPSLNPVTTISVFGDRAWLYFFNYIHQTILQWSVRYSKF